MNVMHDIETQHSMDNTKELAHHLVCMQRGCVEAMSCVEAAVDGVVNPPPLVPGDRKPKRHPPLVITFTISPRNEAK